MNVKIPDGTKQQIKRNIIAARTWLNEIIDIADGFNVTFLEPEFVETKIGLQQLKEFCEIYRSLMLYLQESSNDITTHPFVLLKTVENYIASITDANRKFAEVLTHFDKISILEVSQRLTSPFAEFTSTLKRLILGVTEVCISNIDPNGNVVAASIKLREYLLEFSSDLRRIFIALKPIKLYNEKSMKLEVLLRSLLSALPNDADECKSLLVQQYSFRENIDTCRSEKIHQTLIDLFSSIYPITGVFNTSARNQLHTAIVGNLTKWKNIEIDAIREITGVLINVTVSTDSAISIPQNSKMFLTLLMSRDIRFTYTVITDKLQLAFESISPTIDCQTDFNPTKELAKVYEDSIFQFSKSIRQSTNLTTTLNQIVADILRLQNTVVNLKKDIIVKIKSDPFKPQNVHSPLESINFDDDSLSADSSTENNFL